MSAPATSLPFDPDAERAVLGAVLLNNETLSELEGVLAPDDFHAGRHKAVFAAMLAMFGRGESIDTLTLKAQLEATTTLAEAGGLPYLITLDASVPATANIRRYADVVHEKAMRRRLIAAGTAMMHAARDPEQPFGDVLDRAERDVLAVAEQRTGIAEVTTIAPSVHRVFRDIERRYEDGADVSGLRTGIMDLDTMITGLHPGQFVIVAGRPGAGKSVCGLNWAESIAHGTGKPAIVFSLEMPDDELIMRLMASEARVPLQHLRTGHVRDSDWPKLARACDRLHASKIVIRGENTLSGIRSVCRRVRAKFGGLSAIVIDYLQLMHGDSKHREQEIAGISTGLKELAKELEIPVVALSQLNRGLERREDKRPVMSDLRESGNLEQDADLIVFVYRDEVYNPKTEDKGIAELIVAKQRNGPIGTVRVAFPKEFTRFENLAHDAQNDAQRAMWG